MSHTEVEEKLVEHKDEQPTPARWPARAASFVADRAGQVAGIVLLGALAVALWSLLYRLELFSELILPSPSETGDQFVRIGQDLFEGGFVAERMWSTLQATLGGFAVAGVVGVILGMLVGETKIV